MHALHRILVKLEDKDETIDEIRSVAKSETEDYYNAYDWRETDTAGRWEGEYPCNVILGRDEPDKIIEELITVKKEQENVLRHHVESLKKYCPSMNIEDIIKNSPRSSFGEGGLISYHLKCISSLLVGAYDFDSAFFNTEECDSIINDELINEIRKKPEDWAVVLFDCHF